MPQSLAPTVISTIGNAVGPAALITTTAILLSGFTAKYSSLSDQMRHLTTEYRIASTTPARRDCVKHQLALFHRRIAALWGASTLLSLGLLCFIVTVLAVLLSPREVRLGPVGIGALLLGLILVAGAVGLELHEISLARLTVAGEFADIFSDDA